VAVVPTSAALPAAADVSAVSSYVEELTPTAMGEVRGRGFWSKLKDIVRKVSRWVWDNRAWILQAIAQNTRRETTPLGTWTSVSSRDDFYSQNEAQDDYYDALGTLVSSTLAVDPEQFLYTTVSFDPGL
jgi:hypothetical protein